MQWHGLAIVSCARASGRDWYVERVAEAQHCANLFRGQRLHSRIGVFAIEQWTKDRRVPVEVAGQAFNDGGLRDNARWVAKHVSQLRCERLQLGCLLLNDGTAGLQFLCGSGCFSCGAPGFESLLHLRMGKNGETCVAANGAGDDG